MMGITQPSARSVVLIVESELISRLLLCRVLIDNGYSVLEASEPFEGESLFRTKARVDLLITSQGKNWTFMGTQLVRSLRSQQPVLPAIIMTGGGPIEPDEHVKTIYKPFKMADFLALYRRFYPAPR